jgi:3-hydroxybutyryl-CoA dehydrogenase
VRYPQFQRRIQRSTIHPGLTSGHDAFDEKRRWGWHESSLGDSLQSFSPTATVRETFTRLLRMPLQETEDPIANVLIIGAGWTGRQIAGQMAAFGVNVSLVDPFEPALEASRTWILNQRQRFGEEGFWPLITQEELLKRLDFICAKGPEQILAHYQQPPGLILESIPEQVALKRRTLKQFSEAFGPPTIIASNSSYFTPSTFSEHIAAPERFAHFHFHVPIWKATIVDIASSPRTSEQTRAKLVQLAKRIGQTPIVNRAENTGYVFNWMLKSLLQSALQLLDRGVATPEEIELAWKKATGMPAGPFGIMDQIGLDIIHQTMSHARFVDGDAVWGPLVEPVESLVKQGHLGVKTGRGFFEYPDGQLPGG